MAIGPRVHAFFNNLIRQPSDYERVREMAFAVERARAAAGLSAQEAAEVVAARVFDDPLREPLALFLEDLFAYEGYFDDPPAIADTIAEQWAQRERLERQRGILAALDDRMGMLVTVLRSVLPQVRAGDPDSLFTAPLYQFYPNVPEAMDTLVGMPFAEEVQQRQFLDEHATRIEQNVALVDERQVRMPSKSNISDPDRLITTYLGGTPWPKLLATTVPLHVPQEKFFEHMHVVGGSGAGKTQWLQTLILHHVEQEPSPALVVVDSQGDLINTFLSREIADRVGERLIHITPKDVDYPPAINIFDIPDRVEGYDKATQEQITAGVIDLFDYLFRGLLADLTAKQSVFFKMVARLLLTMPEAMGRNATIMDILYLMEDKEQYRAAIDKLPEVHRRFFDKDFEEKTFNQTKEQIRYRINAIIENPTLYRLFTTEHTKVDIFSELQNGSIILVDTAKDFLKSGSSYFGRIFIGLVLQAVLERAALPADKRHPAFLVVDEAQDYFDTNIDDLLTEARKYKLGTVFAHQYMGQTTQQLRASLAANTSIKLASGVSTADAKTLAPDLRTTSDFILEQPKLQFACHIRGVTSQAISLPITAGKLEQYEQLDDATKQAIRERNREKVSHGPPPPPEEPPDTPDEPPEPPVDDPGSPSPRW